MATSNEKIFDAMVRQQVRLQAMGKGEAMQLVHLLEQQERTINGMIRARLEALGPNADFTTLRLKSFLKELDKKRNAVLRAGTQLKTSMKDVAAIELAASEAIVTSAIPFEVQLASPSLPALKEAVLNSPFGPADAKQLVDQWIKGVDASDAQRLAQAVSSGMANGETIDQIEKRVHDATNLTKQHVEALTRTAVNHSANTARNQFFEDNQDVVQALHWLSTLDGRTSPICRANDGKNRPVSGDDYENVPEPHLSTTGPQTPPAHLRCRSLMIALLDGETLADLKRPYVASKATRAQREKDFRKQAKAEAGDDWKKMSRAERNAKVKELRDDWNADVNNIGTVPADTTYDTWFRNQDPELQREILGKTKFEMWNEADQPHMDQFVDSKGNTLTIKQLNEKGFGADVELETPDPAIVAPEVVESPLEQAYRAERAELDHDLDQAVRDRVDLEEELQGFQDDLSKAKKGTNAYYIAEDRVKNIQRRLADHDDWMDDIRRRQQISDIKHRVAQRRARIQETQSGFDGTDEVAYNDWVDGLSKQDRGDLWDWGDTDGNAAIRRAMRDGTDDPELLRAIENLERLHAEAPANSGTVYRGFKPRREQWEEFLELGGVYDDSFHSATWDWGVAYQDFATSKFDSRRVNVVMTIKGSRRGKLIQTLTGHSNEHEILMPSGEYRIIGEPIAHEAIIGGNIETLWEIIVEEI